MKKTLFTLSLLAALVLSGCNENNPIDPIDNNDPVEEPFIRTGGIVDRIFKREDPAPLLLSPGSKQKGYAQMGADFAQKLFNQLCLKAKPNENVCISPLSLEIALGMLANGANDEACTELLDIICGKGASIDDLNAWYFTLRNALEATNCVSLANAMWAQPDYPIKPDFFSVNQTYYDAEVGFLDFTKTQEAVDSICQWAYDHTYGAIRALNLPINEFTRLVLANATWFGSQWYAPFLKEMTKKDIFTKANGEKQSVDMMQQTNDYRYAAFKSYCLLEIPFEYHSFSMLIALPNKGYTTNKIISEIDWSQLKGETLVNLRFPKFNFKTTNTLLSHLKELGVEKILSLGALSGINEELVVEFINQDVSVSFDEKGAEMAAVTTISSKYTAGPGGNDKPEPINFFVDHPFVFALRDNVSHNILFIGKVESIEEN